MQAGVSLATASIVLLPHRTFSGSVRALLAGLEVPLPSLGCLLEKLVCIRLRMHASSDGSPTYPSNCPPLSAIACERSPRILVLSRPFRIIRHVPSYMWCPFHPPAGVSASPASPVSTRSLRDWVSCFSVDQQTHCFSFLSSSNSSRFFMDVSLQKPRASCHKYVCAGVHLPTDVQIVT